MFPRRVSVIGTGYVGLTTGACLASLGHHVVCADVDEAKVDRLSRGVVDILEPGLADLVVEGRAAGRLQFVVGAATAVADAEVVFLCLPTPMADSGHADLSVVMSAVADIGSLLPRGSVLVTKSTVPVGTAAGLAALIDRPDVAVVANPEFLREGSGVSDFLNPDRVVVGSDDADAAERVAALYTKLGAPTVLTDVASAELAKYAANCFLAMKLSYVNAVAELCEALGADIGDVTEAMGYDRRIGQSFLAPGPGWGGSCLPKDTAALLRVADSVDVGFDLLKATIDTNSRQPRRMVDKIAAMVGGDLSGARIGLLGLAFKAGTNDLRDSPALAVAKVLSAEGAALVAFDPGVSTALAGEPSVIDVVGDPYLVAKDADAVVLLTEWPQFRGLDWVRMAGLMRRPHVLDTRNHLDHRILERAGIRWHGVGRLSSDVQ